MILARSFARIHETNLKVSPHPPCNIGVLITFLQKQGVLPLWFVDKADYSKIGSGDLLETFGLVDVFAGKPGASVRIRVTKLDKTSFEINTKHTMSADQLKWLRAGSALNYIRSSAA